MKAAFSSMKQLLFRFMSMVMLNLGHEPCTWYVVTHSSIDALSTLYPLGTLNLKSVHEGVQVLGQTSPSR
jgi:hypothetical protein